MRTSARPWALLLGALAVALLLASCGDAADLLEKVKSIAQGGEWVFTVDNPFGMLYGMGAVVHEFGGTAKMCITGGGLALAVVRTSTDGVNWPVVTTTPGWAGRRNHAAVVFDTGSGGRIVVMGGYDDHLVTPVYYYSDVWESADGASWTKLVENAAWDAREGLTAVVLNGVMYVMGGQNLTLTYMNDVHSSTDGVSWTPVGTFPGPRRAHASVVFNNRMWILGGNDSGVTFRNDVLSSANGAAWDVATASAPWSPRGGLRAAVYNGAIWVTGGTANGTTNLNDVWVSSNGTSWERRDDAPWKPRRGHGFLAFGGRLWVLGGMTDSGTTDVWYYTE